MSMPRYYFNVYHDGPERDEVGSELQDRKAACREATIAAGQIIHSLEDKLKPGCDWRLEVTDEFAEPLYLITVSARNLP
jgi:hypothetical protein